MEGILSSLEILTELRCGKYSRWAERLDADGLQATILAVGEFGRRYSNMRRLDGKFPAPTFRRMDLAECRVVWALEAFAFIYVNEPLECRLHVVGGFSLSPKNSAFSPEFAHRLARNPLTAWAKNMDENSLALLLWNIGEYCIRMSFCPPPTFIGPAKYTLRMRAALRYLKMIYDRTDGSWRLPRAIACSNALS